MLDSGLLSHDDIDDLRPHVYARIASEAQEQRWIKVHDAFTALADGEPLLGRSARAAVYLVRDPRDVAISLSHHNNKTIDAAIAFMNQSDGAFCGGRKGMESQLRQKLQGWSGHVISWLDQTEIPVLAVRYEDLKADPARFFCAAMAFAGREAGIAEIERAIRHADFAELQRQESEKGFAERELRTAPFFRAGRPGGWHDALTPEQIARIEDAHAPVMGRLGYVLSSTIRAACSAPSSASRDTAQLSSP